MKYYAPECGMSKSKWEKERQHKRRLLRDIRKLYDSDSELEWNVSHFRMFTKDIINKIGCECKAEQMRIGIFCKTCQLIHKLQNYTLNLFKDTAEGRLPT